MTTAALSPSFSLGVRIQRIWLFIFIALIPFSTFYLVERPFAISPINVFSIGFIILGLLNLCTGAIKFTFLKDKGTWYVLGGLFLVMAYALLFTHPLRNGIGLWVSRLAQPFLVGLFVQQMLSAGKLKVVELIRVLFASLLLLVIGGILQLAHIIPMQNVGRISVAYQWPNTFARYVMILLIMTFPWLVQGFTQNMQTVDEPLAQGKQLYGYVVLWFFGGLLLLGSVSYNGVVSCAVGLAAVIVFLPRGHFQKFKIWVLSTMAALGALILLNAHRLPKWEMSVTSSKVTRLQFWQVAVGVIKDHLWTGIGLKSWETHYYQFALQYLPPLTPIWLSTSEQPHNVFLDSLLKAGIPGLIAISVLLIWPIWRGIQLQKYTGTAQWFGLGFLAYGVSLLMFGLIDDPIWSDDTMPLLFILFFVASWLYTQHQSKKA